MNDLRMPDVNTVLIAGNLTRDPSFRRTTNGTPVANFWIASNRKFKDNTGQWRESVCYVGVVAWYKLAETCAENLHRGSAVMIEGELQSRSLRSDDGRNRNIVEIKARRVQFLNKRDESEGDDFHSHHNVENDETEPDDEEETKTEVKKISQYAEEAETSDSDESTESSEPDKSTEEQSVPQKDEAQNSPPPEQDNPMKGKFDFGYQDIE